MEIDNRELFEQLIADALQQEFSGWDFSFLANRWNTGSPSWDYPEMVRKHFKPNTCLLDMDTGGGELLASLQPLPKNTYATEGYLPNVSVAKNKLEPMGVKVAQTFDHVLPFEDCFFDLVLNRHGSFQVSELDRVLKPGGRFITQQVGGRDNFEINQLLQEHPDFVYSYWTLELAIRQLSEAGFEILDQKEEFPETTITDIGGLVFYLKVISWQIPDFSVENYYDKVAGIHNRIQKDGVLKVHSHRFLIAAKKQ